MAPMDSTTIKIYGPLRDLTLPPICPACGAAASVPLRIERVFARERRRRGVISTAPRGITTYHCVALTVPFCHACAARHMAERAAAADTPPSHLRSTAFMYGVVAAVAMAGALLFGAFVWNAYPGGWRPALTFAASIAAGCAAFAGWFAHQVINTLRAGATPPPTSITAVFDVSDNQAARFEPEWRVYRLRNATYARAFAQANAAWLWDETSPRFARAARLRHLAGTLRVATIAVLLVAFILFALRAGRP
ncbi:MAG: hypothetical protein HXY39_20195 [Chloroflexi bacterium]|nr:hypothetical protein [Chloroflexota bacterium]